MTGVGPPILSMEMLVNYIAISEKSQRATRQELTVVRSKDEKRLMIKKVIAYIDGFNLYFGMKSKNWQK